MNLKNGKRFLPELKYQASRRGAVCVISPLQGVGSPLLAVQFAWREHTELRSETRWSQIGSERVAYRQS